MLEEVVSEEKETTEPGGDAFAKLMAEAAALERRCETSYNSYATHRRQYRELRRRDPNLGRQYLNDIESYPEPDRTLNFDLDSFYNAICRIYLSPSHRQADIRALVGANKRLLQELYYYAFRMGTEFGNTGNKDILLHGIAAASIDNGRGIRDFDDPLGRLYGAAQERGRDPSFFFFLVASFSEKGTQYKLENFEQSEYFVRFVKPHLRKPER
jgi:GNAT superfamily N-acetyltransferase